MATRLQSDAPVSAARKTWIVVYDIADDKRRTKMARWFEARGDRVQESVFELTGSTAQIDAWLDEARKAPRFDAEVDSLRCYGLCEACTRAVTTWGVGPKVRVPGKAVIA